MALAYSAAIARFEALQQFLLLRSLGLDLARLFERDRRRGQIGPRQSGKQIRYGEDLQARIILVPPRRMIHARRSGLGQHLARGIFQRDENPQRRALALHRPAQIAHVARAHLAALDLHQRLLGLFARVVHERDDAVNAPVRAFLALRPFRPSRSIRPRRSSLDERQRPPLELIAVVVRQLLRVVQILRLAAHGVIALFDQVERILQAILLQRDGQVRDVNADPVVYAAFFARFRVVPGGAYLLDFSRSLT